MKRLFENIALALTLVAVISSTSVAQQKVNKQTHPSHPYKGIKATLTDEQKEIIKTNSETAKRNKAKLEATYSAKQKEILADTSLHPKVKRKALQSTYSNEQQELLADHKKEMIAGKEKLNATFTDEQKSAFNSHYKSQKYSNKRPVRNMDATRKNELRNRKAPSSPKKNNIHNPTTSEQK